ncbi:type II toxin-antitoxin system VapC family toxin [Aquirufa lenticrescens]
MIPQFYIDTNVLIDFLADRKPFSESATTLFDLAVKKKIKLYISAISYNNIYYILQRENKSHKKTIALLELLSEDCQILDATKTILQSAMRSDFKDFEDAIQYYSAKGHVGINAIVTRNPKDFAVKDLAILSPDEALSFAAIQ